VAVIRTGVSEERIAFINRVTRIGELGTTCKVLGLLVTANVLSSSIIVTLMIRRKYVSQKRRFLKEPHGVTSQETA
jgi:hypothetical protein